MFGAYKNEGPTINHLQYALPLPFGSKHLPLQHKEVRRRLWVQTSAVLPRSLRLWTQVGVGRDVGFGVGESVGGGVGDFVGLAVSRPQYKPDLVASEMPDPIGEADPKIALATWGGVRPGFAERMPAAIPATSGERG